jgi:hypothetical protein
LYDLANAPVEVAAAKRARVAKISFMNQMAFRRLGLPMLLLTLLVLNFSNFSKAQQIETHNKRSYFFTDTLLNLFHAPPDSAKSRVYWFWEFNRVTKAGITRDLEQFKAKGISGVNLICTGGYAGKEPLPGVPFLGKEWRTLFRYAVSKANKLHIEIGFNLAGGWTMMGPSVTKDNAMKKVVSAELRVLGPVKFSGTLPQAETVEAYYHDIMVQAFRVPDSTKAIDPKTIIDLTNKLATNGHFEWDVPVGKWVILRTGYTLTGATWSKWHAYPEGDTFKGGEGYEIDYLSMRRKV